MSLNELIENDVVGKKIKIKNLQHTKTFDKKQLQEELEDKILIITRIDPNYWVVNNVEVVDSNNLKVYHLSHKDIELYKDE